MERRYGNAIHDVFEIGIFHKGLNDVVIIGTYLEYRNLKGGKSNVRGLEKIESSKNQFLTAGVRAAA